MPTTSCPICRTLYEGSEDHPWDPCTTCWQAGWRVDACGNKRQVTMPATVPVGTRASKGNESA